MGLVEKYRLPLEDLGRQKISVHPSDTKRTTHISLHVRSFPVMHVRWDDLLDFLRFILIELEIDKPLIHVLDVVTIVACRHVETLK